MTRRPAGQVKKRLQHPTSNHRFQPRSGTGAPVRRHALVTIEAAMLLSRPSLLIAPFLKVGRAALWQIVTPCRFERRARSLEVSRGAVPIVARIAAGIEAAAPLPLIRRWRSSRSLDDHPDADAGHSGRARSPADR